MKAPRPIITAFTIGAAAGIAAGFLVGPISGAALAVLVFIIVACCQWSSHITQEEER